jgi:hypothetical protein
LVYIRTIRGGSKSLAHQAYPACGQEGLYTAIATKLEHAPEDEAWKEISRARVGTSIFIPPCWLDEKANEINPDKAERMWTIIADTYVEACDNNGDSHVGDIKDAMKEIHDDLPESSPIKGCFAHKPIPTSPFHGLWLNRKEPIKCADSLAT